MHQLLYLEIWWELACEATTAHVWVSKLLSKQMAQI